MKIDKERSRQEETIIWERKQPTSTEETDLNIKGLLWQKDEINLEINLDINCLDFIKFLDLFWDWLF